MNPPDRSPDRSSDDDTGSVKVRCSFVRQRNALVVQGKFTSIYTDYYLHLMENQIRYEGEEDHHLKEGLAALALHLASRPRNEAIAWTLSWQSPPQNFFMTGSNRQGNIAGRVFTRDVRERENNLFYTQTSVAGQPGRQSMIEVETLDLPGAGEQYYLQSEQRPGRYFRMEDEEYALVTAQPDCDLEWLQGLDVDSIYRLPEVEEMSLLEIREYQFSCGCSQEKLFPMIAGMSEETLAEIFGDSEVIPATCPRCGARYVITREALEAYVSENA